YALSQNYPNPFNPATTIDYTLAKEGNVQLAVYDVLGRLVTTLVSGVEAAGPHTVRFDGSRLSSGVYYYTLRAGEFTATRSLILMK
ncbi:MAG TPA: T9SS type A sorting domain-containing protein, partial [Bacteroidota bacterium]